MTQPSNRFLVSATVYFSIKENGAEEHYSVPSFVLTSQKHNYISQAALVRTYEHLSQKIRDQYKDKEINILDVAIISISSLGSSTDEQFFDVALPEKNTIQ